MREAVGKRRSKTIERGEKGRHLRIGRTRRTREREEGYRDGVLFAEEREREKESIRAKGARISL